MPHSLTLSLSKGEGMPAFPHHPTGVAVLGIRSQ